MRKILTIAGWLFLLGLLFIPWRMFRTAASVSQGQRITVQLRTSSYSTTIQGNSIFGDGGCPNGGGSMDLNTARLTAPYAYECKEEKLAGQAVVNFPAGPLTGTVDASGDLVLDAPVLVTGQVTITGEISRNIGGDNRRFLEVSGDCGVLVTDTKQISLTPEQWSVSFNNCNLTKLSRATQAGSYNTPAVRVRYFGGRLVLNSGLSASYATSTTGCPDSLAAAAPEQAQDTLQLVSATPGNDAPVSGALLKLGGLKVTVRYLLQSRAGATLRVRLFDEEGRVRAFFAGEIDIARPQSCPNPLPTREFDLLPRSVDFTTLAFGSVPTSLKLSAQMLDSQTGGIFKSADLTYRVIPDVIAFESNPTPTINGKAAPDGSTFPEDGKIRFDSGLRYHLTNDERGKLRLEAFNFTGQSIARKDFAATVPASAQPLTVGFPLDFEFTVPPTVSQITIAAYLLAENGTVLKISVPLTYRTSGFGIALGALAPGTGQFRPFEGAPPVLVAGARVKAAFGLGEERSLVLGVTEDLTSLPTNTTSALLLSERMADGTSVREDQFLARSTITALPRPSWFITLPINAPNDADLWELKLVFFPVGKDPLFSKPLRLNIDRVRVVPKQFTPSLTAELQRGKPEKFRCKLEYNANRSGASQVFAHIEYNSLSGEPAPPPIKLLDLRAGDHSPVDPPFRDFDVPIPINEKVTVVRVFFSLSNATDARRAVSPPIEYRDFIKELQIPGGITSVNTGLGVAASILQNSANRGIRVKRQATQFKGLLDSFGLKLNAELEGSANTASHFALSYAEAASLLRDFIGVNAYWEFNPSIPADGSFAADLTFSYDAEMLPDDPNFSEAALKVMSFDPDSGQLVSYPTTVNTSAKTATARVNGLARYYTLGVFGPFAQRTLNFPVLQSSDAFATRFHLVNAGAADATLTLRAYDDAGANLQAPNLVNPLTSTLSAARMLMGSVSDLFKATVPLDGWVQTRANRNFVAGYELLSSGNRFDGLNAPSGYDSALILPEAVFDATQSTEIHLANATNFSGVATLALHDATGRLVASEEIQLEAKARFAQRLQDTFQNLAQPFTGYLLILSERDLAAAALQIHNNEITALNAQPLGGGATRFYAPYLSLGGPATARLTLVNPTAQAAQVTLRLINKPGAPATAPVNLTLSAGQQLQRNFSELFSYDRLLLSYSTLVVESNVAGLAGAVTLFNGSSAIPFRATLPLESAPAQRLLFAHLNTSDGFYTELGLFNPSASAARVTLACFKPDGASLGQTTFNVAANTVSGDFLDSLVSGARGQAAGYFTLTSDQPIVAGAAFGTDAGTALAALPPQILPDTTTNALAPVSAASFSAQTLAPESIVAAFGVNLASSVITANQVPLPTTLAGTTVEVRDSLGAVRLAPLFFVAPGQINLQIPPGTANGAATITVTNGAGTLSQGTVTIAGVAPGIFTANANGLGVPAAVAVRIKASGTQSFELIARFDAAQNRFVAVPLDLGPPGEQVVLVLFGTGLRGRSSLLATSVTIGGVPADVGFAGAQGDLVGLDQVNLTLPRALAGRGEVDLTLTVDGSAANTVRVAFAGNQACNYTLSASSQNIVSGGGAGSVNVTAQSGCAWTATSNAAFITITSGANGTGNGAVNFTVAANPGNQRTGTLTIAGQTFTVTQNGRPCSYSIPVTSQSFNANANTGSINVTATSGCAWTATSNAAFIAITNGASGNGNGVVNFSVAANTSTSQRSGTMTIAGITFTVTQAAGPALSVNDRR